MFDGKAYGEGIVEIVKGYVEREIAPIKAENEDLRKRLATLEECPASIVEALKDNGELVLTLPNGRLIRTGIRDGEQGKDGLGFDDLDFAVLDDDRTIELSFRRGDEEKVFTAKWPTVIDRGVYKAGQDYCAGDGVTWGGSFWIAQKDTAEKPDTPESGWRLAVKKGRDGKDARG